MASGREGAAAPSLAARLTARIRAEGPLRLDRYMRACLTEGPDAYYRAGRPIGAAGDFVTAPEISQIFGEAVGLWLIDAWGKLGAPRPLSLVELGPGRGALMADALRVIAKLAPELLAAAEITLVEASERLRAEQRARLAPLAEGARSLVWRADPGAPAPGPTLLVANEFFDALPIRQLRFDGADWREQVVALGADGALALRDGPAAPEAAARAPAPPGPGAILEICEEAERIAGEIGARLARDPGAALVVDYGYDDAAWRAAGGADTFQAVARHRPVSPFEAPGAADLTAHVAFDPLCAAAGAAGAAARGPIGQGALLRGLGAELRAARLAQARPDQAERIAADLHRLTHPQAMGLLFKAVAWTTPGAPAPAAFETAPLRMPPQAAAPPTGDPA